MQNSPFKRSFPWNSNLCLPERQTWLIVVSMLVSRLCYHYHAMLSITSTLSPLSSLFKHSSGIYLAANVEALRWRLRRKIWSLFSHCNPVTVHSCKFYTRAITMYLPNKNFESLPYSFHVVRMLLLQAHTAVHYHTISIKTRNETTKRIMTI